MALKLRTVSIQLLLLGIGVALVFWVAPVGFLSSNQSIIFDGGWRILSGQIPFRDFTAPNGLLPSFMQAGFFAIFGVTWFAYMVHSAIINGLFCISVYQLLRLLGLGEKASLFYGALSGVIFYPPVGLPYMEQHAFFFLIATLYLALSLKIAKTNRSFYFRVCAIVLLLFAAYLCKQIPTVIFVPLILGVSFTSAEGRYRKKLLYALGAFGFATTLLIMIVAVIAGLDYQLLRYYGFTLPSTMGRARLIFFERRQVQDFLNLFRIPLIAIGILTLLSGLTSIWSLRFRYVFRKMAVTLLFIALLISTAYLWKSIAAVIVCAVVLYTLENRRSDGVILLAGLLVVASLIFTVLTNMLFENGMPLVYLAVGLIHYAYTKRVGKFAAILLWLLPAITFVDASIFQVRINLSRSALFISDEEFATQPPVDIHEPASMNWFKGPIYGGYTYNANELAELVQFLGKQSENFWVFGDASILYGLSNKPSINPALWYHYKLTIPAPGTNEFIAFQQRLLEKFRHYNVKWVVIENTFTGTGCKLGDFELVNEYIRSVVVDTIRQFSVTLIKLN